MSEYAADIVVYGGTAVAVTAAVQAKRMGKPVIVVGPDKHHFLEQVSFGQ